MTDVAAASPDGGMIEPGIADAAGTVEEDSPDLLDPKTRSLEGPVVYAAGEVAQVPESGSGVIEADEAGDADRIADEIDLSDKPVLPQSEKRLNHDAVAHRIAVQLKHVEQEVRNLLEPADPKRKRKLSGTRRWRELEEDVIEWRYAGRFDDASLDRLRELINRRNYLFGQLRFVVGTRRRWNT